MATMAHSIPTPLTYQEAVGGADKELWLPAIGKELAKIKARNVWEFAFLPRGRKAIKTKWVFKVKELHDGALAKTKARIVIKGFLQIR